MLPDHEQQQDNTSSPACHETPGGSRRSPPVNDPGALAPLVEQVIAADAAKTDEYRAGKTGLLGIFVGQVMRQSGGNANPRW